MERPVIFLSKAGGRRSDQGKSRNTTLDSLQDLVVLQEHQVSALRIWQIHPDRCPFSTSSQNIVVVLFWGVCSHLLGRFLSWGWAHSPPSCSSYCSQAILGSKILAVFHVISPAWGRGKGLTLPVNHFFFPPPICSVILLLLHTPLIFDHFYFSLILWLLPLFVGSFLNLCPPCSHILAEMLLNDLIFFPSFLKKKKKRKKGKNERKKNSKVPHSLLHWLYAFSQWSAPSARVVERVWAVPASLLLLFVPSPEGARLTPPPPPSLPAAFTSLLALLGSEEPGHL